ncbi:6392_t:CDS:1, partial [Dentiscutata erythropus]
ASIRQKVRRTSMAIYDVFVDKFRSSFLHLLPSHPIHCSRLLISVSSLESSGK